MVMHHHAHIAHPAGEKPDRDTSPVQPVPASADLPHHLTRRADADRVNQAEARLQGQVVPEPLRLLVRIDVTPDPDDERYVVQDRPVVVAQTQPLPDAQGQDALPQRMLHRLTHPEIGSERQHDQQLGQPYTLRPRLRCPHGRIIRPAARR